MAEVQPNEGHDRGEGYVGLPLSCAQPRLGGVSSRQLHAALNKTDATPPERFSEDPENHSANSRANWSGSRAGSCRNSPNPMIPVTLPTDFVENTEAVSRIDNTSSLGRVILAKP